MSILNFNEERQRRWDIRALRLAHEISLASKDPSTKVGALIYDKNNRAVSHGFNGFPRGVVDRPEWLDNREIKYKVILHAEENAILFAQRSLEGCTLIVYPAAPCARCAAMAIQSGIMRVVSLVPTTPAQIDMAVRRDAELRLARQMYTDAGVVLVGYLQQDLGWRD